MAIMELLLHEVTSILVGAVTALLVYGFWQRQHRKCGFPNGPFSFPILGNLPQMVLSKSMGHFLNKCRDKYGNIFTIEFGGSKSVVVSGCHNIHYLLVKNADLTSNRSTQSLAPVLASSPPGLIWAAFPHWKTMKSFSLKVMREEGMNKQTLETKIRDEINRFCEFYIEPRCGQAIELSCGLRKLSWNVISVSIFGGRNEYDDSHFDELINSVDKTARTSMISAIMKNIPFAKYFKCSGLRDSNEALNTLMAEMMDQLARHRAELKRDDPKDIFDMFILHQMSLKDDISAFTDENAGMLAVQLYVAGTETTSTALRWALLYTCLNPKTKRKVHEEIRNEIGDGGLVSYKERSGLPYTQAVLLESLRLANISPYAAPHTLDDALEVDGVVIPAGADLMLNMASVLHDEELFGNPLEFKPERYLTGDVVLKKQRTIPFGIGRRTCLGESLARMKFFIFYVTLLQKYDVRLSKNNKKPDSVPICGVVNHPQLYYMEFHTRY